MTELLDRVWSWYESVCDSISAAAYLVENAPGRIPPSLKFADLAPEAALDTLGQTQKEIEDHAVLALFAVFERSILDHLVSTARNVEGRLASALERRMVSEGLKDLDRWRLGDVLDVYKVRIDSRLVGDVKQVKRYRDWVAHGRRSPVPTQMNPKTAYDRLSEFVRALAT